MLKSVLSLLVLLFILSSAKGQNYYESDPDSLARIELNNGLNQTYTYKGEYFSNLQGLSYELNRVEDEDVSLYYQKYLTSRTFSRAFALTSGGLIGYSFATYIFGEQGNSLDGRLIAAGSVTLVLSYYLSRRAAARGRDAVNRYNAIYKRKGSVSLYLLPTDEGSAGFNWSYRF